MIRVGVFGAGGRMGTTVCRAVLDAPDLELVAAVDPLHAGIDLGQLGVHDTHLQIAAEGRARCATPAPQVAVDFTVIDAARENIAWCAEQRRSRGRRHHRLRRRRSSRISPSASNARRPTR